MAAATITLDLIGTHPAEECVVLTVTNGETYTSKMSSPQVALVSWMESVAATPISVAISGRTLTFACAGITDKKAAVLIKGYK